MAAAALGSASWTSLHRGEHGATPQLSRQCRPLGRAGRQSVQFAGFHSLVALSLKHPQRLLRKRPLCPTYASSDKSEATPEPPEPSNLKDDQLATFGATQNTPVDPARLTGDLSAAIDRAMESEESQALLKDLAEAEARVERARAEMAEIERQERELMALKRELEKPPTADTRLEEADAEVKRLLSIVSAAEEDVRLAGAALVEARSGGGDSSMESRLESAKAAGIAAAGGTVAYLPMVLSRDTPSLIFGLTTVFLSCALLGVTFRYAVRRDVANVKLKSGVVGAFALCQGLARVDVSILSPQTSLTSFDDVMPALTSAGAEAFALLVAALCLEFCLKQGFVKWFLSE